MSHIADIFTLRITCNNTFQTLSHCHDILTKLQLRFLENRLVYTTYKLKYQFNIIKTQQSVIHFFIQTVTINQLPTENKT